MSLPAQKPVPQTRGAGGKVERSRSEQIRDVPVFLFLLASSMTLSSFAGRRGGLSFTLVAVATMLRDLSFAALLSSFIFSLGHGYEGAAGMATVGVLGLVFAMVFLWRGNLVAPIVEAPLLRHR
jgi:Type II CAAX prenyl endopeptidase Rce1-like